MPSRISHHSLSSFFISKKSQILESLASSTSPNYTDKSPKGSIDSDIIDLIDLINSHPGYVTTSSCAGRVAVFVEGRKIHPSSRQQDEFPNGIGNETDTISESEPDLKTSSGPGGKGAGNRWLYVSHSPVTLDKVGGDNSAFANGDTSHPVKGETNSTKSTGQMGTYHDLFNLTPASSYSHRLSRPTNGAPSTILTTETTRSIELQDQAQQLPTSTNIRLVKLSFSPLILHVLCSSLHTAKPLLAAAINAGFRESGVQSLKALDDEDAGVMVAIRTAGLSFETVIGWVDEQNEDTQENEIYRSCVSEEVLKVFVEVANDRFGWNTQRRERLRTLLVNIGKEQEQESTKKSEWEDRTVRKERKREEGLKRQKEKETAQKGYTNGTAKETEDGVDTETLEDLTIFDNTP